MYKGLELQCARGSSCFGIMGVSVPSLHRDSTDKTDGISVPFLHVQRGLLIVHCNVHVHLVAVYILP